MKIALSIILAGVVVSIYAHPLGKLNDFDRSTDDVGVADGLCSETRAREVNLPDLDCETMVEILSSFSSAPHSFVFTIKEDPSKLLDALRTRPNFVHVLMSVIESLLERCTNTTVFKKFVTDRDGPVMKFIDIMFPQVDVHQAQACRPTTTMEAVYTAQAPATTDTVKDIIFTPEELKKLRSKIPKIEKLLDKVDPEKIRVILKFIPNLPDVVDFLHVRLLRFININAELIGEMLNRFRYE